MTPGPKLDALVATHIFSFQRVEMFGRMNWAGRGSNGHFPVYASCCLDTIGNECNNESLPYFSTSIVAAWEIVERFRPFIKIDGRGLDTSGPHDRRGWVCRIWTGTGPEVEGSVSAFAETAPHAICLAALKAFGIEVPS